MRKQHLKFLIFLYLAGLFFLHTSKTLAALNVPLTIQEALPAGASGLDRVNENFTSGIPLSEDSEITNVNQLGLSNSSAAQFRALAWWPNGNIKWVLVDGQTSLSAGGSDTAKSLTDGSGNFGGADLATDNGTNISINTGNAQFVIKKTNFNVFDSVVVDGQTLVSNGNMGRVEGVATDDTVYSSVNDDLSTATIEENGPVKTVIKAMGSLKSDAGVRLVDYTVRFYFYKGRSNVKTDVILRNASKFYPQSVDFKNIEIIVSAPIVGQKTVTFSRKSDVVTTTLTAGESAYMYQGYNTQRRIIQNIDSPASKFDNTCYYWSPPAAGSCVSQAYTYDPANVGLAIQSGLTTLNSLGNTSEWTQGYAGVDNSAGQGLNVAMRYMSSMWPSGFEFRDNGEVSVEFYSKRNGGKTQRLLFGRPAGSSSNGAHGKHELREIMWDFHTQTGNGNQSLHALQYPLLARANFLYYMQTKAIFDQKEFVTPSEQENFYGALGKTGASIPSLANPAMDGIYRVWNWKDGGGYNQTELALNNLTDFLRTGLGGFYLQGEQRTIFDATSQLPRSDDYSTENILPSVAPPVVSTSTTGMFFDNDHAHLMSIPFYYFISGNEEIKDAWIDFGEYEQFSQDQGIYQIPSAFVKDSRSYSRKLRNYALAYEFSCQMGDCNETYKSGLETAVNALLEMRDDPTIAPTLTVNSPMGWNKDRGYLYWDNNTADIPNRNLHSFFIIWLGFEALWQTHRIMEDTDWNYVRLSELEDCMTGLSKFILDEYIEPNPPSGTGQSGQWTFRYNYRLDLNRATQFTTPFLGMSYYPVSRAAVWAFKQTGDSSYLDKAAWMSWETWSYAYPRNPSDLQDQALMYYWVNKNTIPTWGTIVPSVSDNGGGSYTLSWTVPQSVNQYRIKYSDKPIVEWLGFENVARTFQYDPASYTAFFAANNISNNPAPQVAGTTQSITLTGLPENQYFSMKVLTTTSDIIAPAAPNGLAIQ